MSEIDMLDGNRVIGHIIKRLREKILQIGQDRGQDLRTPFVMETLSTFRKLKLDVPKFVGENPSNYMHKANQYFYYYNTSHQNILMASFYMEKEASVWFQQLWDKYDFIESGQDCQVNGISIQA